MQPDPMKSCVIVGHCSAHYYERYGFNPKTQELYMRVLGQIVDQQIILGMRVFYVLMNLGAPIWIASHIMNRMEAEPALGLSLFVGLPGLFAQVVDGALIRPPRPLLADEDAHHAMLSPESPVCCRHLVLIDRYGIGFGVLHSSAIMRQGGMVFRYGAFRLRIMLRQAKRQARLHHTAS